MRFIHYLRGKWGRSLILTIILLLSISTSVSGAGIVQLVEDLESGTGSANPEYLTVYNDKLYFASNPSNGTGTELWYYDGSAISQAADIRSGSSSSSPEFFAVYNNKLYFAAKGDDGLGKELWSFDGSTASLAVDIYSGSTSSHPKYLTVYNGILYFAAQGNDETEEELWSYDGSTASLVADIYSGDEDSDPEYLAVYNNKLYFSADGGDGAGAELWSYNGSTVTRVADIYSGSDGSHPSNLTVYNDKLYFRASDSGGQGLWVYDGSNISLALSVKICDDDSTIIVYNDKLYYSVYTGSDTNELWSYDGSTASLAVSIDDANESNPLDNLEVYNGVLYFAANIGEIGRELWSFTEDNVAPTVSITSTASGSTKTSPIPVTITFSESVTGFTVSDLTVTNGSAGNFSGSGAAYTANITPSAEGTVSVKVNANVASDAAGNGNNASSTFSITYDSTAPTVNITSSDSSPTGSSPIPVTITFSESVTGFTVSDLTVTNGSAGDLSGSGKTYTANITPSADGTVSVKVNANTASDSAGNGNSASTTFSISYDGTAPTVDITSSASSPTGSSPIPVTITFSESVTGFTVSDLTVTNGSAGDLSGSGTTYTANITPSADGTVSVKVNANAASDSAGNGNSASSTFSITYDATPPEATFTLWDPSTSPTNADSLTFRVTFNEDVENVDSSDFIVDSASSATITAVDCVDAATYNVTISGGDLADFNGSVGLDFSTVQEIYDLNGNAYGGAEPNTDEVYTVDNTSLATGDIAFTRSNPSSSQTNADTLVFQVTFLEDVQNVDSSDFAVNSSSTATVTAVDCVDAATYNVTVSGGDLADFNGDLGLDFSTNQDIADLCGNVYSGSEPDTDESYTVDNIAPTVIDSNPDDGAEMKGISQLSIIYSEDMQHDGGSNAVDYSGNYRLVEANGDGFQTDSCTAEVGTQDTDISINNVVYDNNSEAGPFSATIYVNEGTELSSGEYRLIVCGAESMQDLAGNNLNDEVDELIDFTVDDTAPTVVDSDPEDGEDIEGTSRLSVTFSKDVQHDGGSNAADYSGNYRLVEANGDGFQADSCKAEVGTQDTDISIDSVVYDNNDEAGPFTATIHVNEGTELPLGEYRLIVCGAESVQDLVGNKLNGGADELIDFTVNAEGDDAPIIVDSDPEDGAEVEGPSRLSVTYSEDMKHNEGSNAANYTGNYRLLEANGDGFQADSCKAEVGTQDTDISIDSAEYDNNEGGGPYTTTIHVNKGSELPIGDYRLIVCGAESVQDLAGNKLNNGEDELIDFTVNVDGKEGPTIVSSSPQNNAKVKGLSQLSVTYSEDIQHDGSSSAGNYTGNYRLLEANGDGFQADSCKADVGTKDIDISIDSVEYDNNEGDGPYTATIQINNSTKLPVGEYRLIVCGTESVQDILGNKLNDGADELIDFKVRKKSSGSGGSSSSGGSGSSGGLWLPATGFPPNRTTWLPIQKAGTYTEYAEISLEIPALKIEAGILGVPKSESGWDLSWLNGEVGWLEGTAFPTWAGNSVLTAHVYDADGQPGLFRELDSLEWGDEVIVHAYGQEYIYKVREVDGWVNPRDMSILELREGQKDYPWLTLLTCRGYDEDSGTYLGRVVVRAVQVRVK